MIVVLPAPIDPTRATISPRPTVRSTERAATTGPYWLARPLLASSGSTDTVQPRRRSRSRVGHVLGDELIGLGQLTVLHGHHGDRLDRELVVALERDLSSDSAVDRAEVVERGRQLRWLDRAGL